MRWKIGLGQQGIWRDYVTRSSVLKSRYTRVVKDEEWTIHQKTTPLEQPSPPSPLNIFEVPGSNLAEIRSFTVTSWTLWERLNYRQFSFGENKHFFKTDHSLFLPHFFQFIRRSCCGTPSAFITIIASVLTKAVGNCRNMSCHTSHMKRTTKFIDHNFFAFEAPVSFQACADSFLHTV